MEKCLEINKRAGTFTLDPRVNGSVNYCRFQVIDRGAGIFEKHAYFSLLFFDSTVYEETRSLILKNQPVGVS